MLTDAAETIDEEAGLTSRAMADPPLFSRCSLGKDRWFWVVFASFEAIVEGEEPIASGYASAAQEAETEALRVVPAATLDRAGLAAHYHRKLAAKKRSEKAATGHSTAQAQEFLYTDWMSDYDSEWSSSPNLIVKKTPKFVFVDKRSGQRPFGDWRDYDRESYALNRAELETEGSTWCRFARDRFYTTPHDQRHTEWSSHSLEVLGLQGGASAEDIKAAYRRLAKRHHPDCGGDPEQFKAVRAAYEDAIRRVAS